VKEMMTGKCDMKHFISVTSAVKKTTVPSMKIKAKLKAIARWCTTNNKKLIENPQGTWTIQ